MSAAGQLGMAAPGQNQLSVVSLDRAQLRHQPAEESHPCCRRRRKRPQSDRSCSLLSPAAADTVSGATVARAYLAAVRAMIKSMRAWRAAGLNPRMARSSAALLLALRTRASNSTSSCSSPAWPVS
jgi:hypothetical protein